MSFSFTSRPLRCPTSSTRRSPIFAKAVQIAGFTRTEANKLFGAPNPAVIDGITLRLRPPVEVRQDFTKRHAELMAQL